MKILAINDAITDSGIAYCRDGKLVMAVNEERFSRRKIQGGFPKYSLNYFIETYRQELANIDKVVFAGILTPTLITRIFSKIESIDKYEEKKKNKVFALLLDIIEYKLKLTTRVKPGSKITNIIKKISEISLRRKLPPELRKKPIDFVEHHLSHIAATFYSSDFSEALAVSFDGFGDGYSGKIYLIKDRVFEKLFTLDALDSFGLFYSLVTVFLGFKEHKHEGKITGLAAFGNTEKVKEDFPLQITSDMKVKYLGRHGNWGIKDLQERFSGYRKEDVAAWLQKNTEECICKIISYFLRKTGQRNICLAGGLFTNVKLNQRIHEIAEVDNIYIYPAMSDTGIPHGAICALLRQRVKLEDIFLGPEYPDKEIETAIKSKGLSYRKSNKIEKEIAEMLVQGKMVARFKGRMEYGPRALGNRSILAQATDKKINKILNEKLKRTEFMPFAPVVLDKFARDYIKNLDGAGFTSRFMTISFPATKKMKKLCPVAVHIDGTIRPQVLYQKDNPSFYKILEEYYKTTGIPVLINTSFNIHEEPIVMTPDQAIKAYLEANLDCLAIGSYLCYR